MVFSSNQKFGINNNIDDLLIELQSEIDQAINNSAGSILTNNATISNIVNNNITSASAIITNATISNIVNNNITSASAIINNAINTNITSSNANITNASIGNATVTNVRATNETVTNLLATNITSASAIINNAINTNITSSNAIITNLSIGNATVTNVSAASANLTNITFSDGVGTNLQVANALNTNATITNLLNTNQTTSNSRVTNSTIQNLQATNSTITNLFNTSQTSTSLLTTNITASNSTIVSGTFSNLLGTNLSAANAHITSTLVATNVTANNMRVGNETISNIFITSGLTTPNAVITNLTNTNVTSNNILVNNNIGIGGTTSNRLLVRGAFSSNVAAALTTFGESQNATLFFGTPFNEPAPYKAAIIARGKGSNSRSALHFSLDDTANNDPANAASLSNTRMMIDSTGVVGIATTTPAHTLDVNGGIRATNVTSTNVLSTNVSSATLNLSTGITSANANFINETTSNLRVTNSINATGSLNTLGSIIVSGGNVGIGSNPSSRVRLQVSGPINVGVGNGFDTIIQRSANSGSNGLVVTGGSGFTEGNVSIITPTDAGNGSMIRLGGGATDGFGGNIDLYAYGPSGGSSNRIRFHRRTGVNSFTLSMIIDDQGLVSAGNISLGNVTAANLNSTSFTAPNALINNLSSSNLLSNFVGSTNIETTNLTSTNILITNATISNAVINPTFTNGITLGNTLLSTVSGTFETRPNAVILGNHGQIVFGTPTTGSMALQNRAIFGVNTGSLGGDLFILGGGATVGSPSTPGRSVVIEDYVVVRPRANLAGDFGSGGRIHIGGFNSAYISSTNGNLRFEPGIGQTGGSSNRTVQFNTDLLLNNTRTLSWIDGWGVSGGNLGRLTENWGWLFNMQTQNPIKIVGAPLVLGSGYNISSATWNTGASLHTERAIIQGSTIGNVDAAIGLDIYNDSRFSQIYPRVDNAFSCARSGNRWSEVWSANGTIQTSDARYKKDVVDEVGLDFVRKLRPVQYKWDADKDGVITSHENRIKHGFLAQEIKKLVEENDDLVVVPDNDEEPMGLIYTEFISILTKAIQDLDDKMHRPFYLRVRNYFRKKIEKRILLSRKTSWA